MRRVFRLGPQGGEFRDRHGGNGIAEGGAHVIENLGQLRVVQGHRRHPGVEGGAVDDNLSLEPFQRCAQGFFTLLGEEVRARQRRKNVGDAATFLAMASRAVLAVKLGPVGLGLRRSEGEAAAQ